MDLTDNQVGKKWPTKRRCVLVSVALVFVIAVVISTLMLVRHYNHSVDDPESGLPAIKVVVSNGCGVDRLAADYARSIEKLNIEVLSLRDTRRPIYDKSIIVVRNSDIQDLARLQQMTGIKRHTIALDESFQGEFEIILGRDFDEFLRK